MSQRPNFDASAAAEITSATACGCDRNTAWLPSFRHFGIGAGVHRALKIRIDHAVGRGDDAKAGLLLPGGRAYRRAANGHLTTGVVAELSRLIMTEAPGVDLVIRPSTRLDLAEQIDVGRIDLAVGVFQQVPTRYTSQILMTQGDLIVMRKGHPVSRRKLALEDLARYPLVTVSVGGQEEGAVGGFILERGLTRQSEMFDRRALETALAAIGAAPRYRITMPHWLAIPAFLASTDMLSITPALPSRVGFRGTLVMRRPPYPIEASVIRGVWHSRNDYHPPRRGCAR